MKYRAPMRTLVHVSDLHFGRSDQGVVDALHESWRTLRPDLVVISGDLTQRAEPHEFEAARRFLESLTESGMRYVVVPGNHDIAPLNRPIERARDSFRNYQTYISEHTEQFYFDGELAIACLNTVRRLQPINGRIRKEQLTQARQWFAKHERALKIVVTHHPLRRNPTRIGRLACLRGGHAHRKLTGFDVDIFLSGHYHRAHIERPHALDVHAGTVSDRLKGEPPSYNVIVADDRRISVSTYHLSDAKTFTHTSTTDVDRKKHKKPLRRRIDNRIQKLKTSLRSNVL